MTLETEQPYPEHAFQDEIIALLEEIGDHGFTISKAVDRNFTSPNEADRNLEPANVVDGLFAIARGLHSVADAIKTEGDG